MRNLREDIRHKLDHLLVPDALKRIEQVKQKLGRLKREVDEVDQQIPFWDRLVFFSDTPDEQRRDEVSLSIETNARVLGELREELALNLQRVGEQYPPFALGMEIERCFRLAKEHLDVEGSLFKSVSEQDELLAALESLAGRVVQVYVPDFDPERLFAALRSRRDCERAAERAREIEPHLRLGVEPCTTGDLSGPVAARLLQGSFFEGQERLAALRTKLTELERSHEEAAAAVPLMDKINVFTDSEAEGRRNALRQERDETRAKSRRAYEESRRVLHEALAAYPPLAVYQRALEVVGVVSLLDAGSEETLNSEGAVTPRAVVSGKALLFRALRRLLETFMEAFPDVPLPLALAQELTDGTAKQTLSPRQMLIREFGKGLEASWATNVREETLGHASMQGVLAQSLKRIRAEISVFDRIIFFVDSVKEQEEDAVLERSDWHRAEAQRLWGELLDVARIVGGELAPFASRDLAVRASHALEAVHTDGGSSSSPRSCGVYGRGEVIGALNELRTVIGGHYKLRGTRSELMRAVANHPPVEGEAPPRRRFQTLDYEEVLRRVAQRIQGTDFAERYARLRENEHAHKEVAFQEEVVNEKISFWDRVNIFSTTPEEAERKELLAQLGELGEDIREDMRVVDRLVDHALEAVYPPALLFFGIGGVSSQVYEIRGVCRSYTVTTGTGNNKRTETRYRCVLEGKSTAQAALRRWCANLVRTYGALPTYHALLEACELAGIVEAGWDWDES